MFQKFLNQFTQTLSDTYHQNQQSIINDCHSNKYNFYRKIKTHPYCEEYLKYISIPSHRIAVTKLRTSDHKLGVETGRYYTIPYNDRHCEYCKSSKIDDEMHFIFECTHNMPERRACQVIQDSVKISRTSTLETIFLDKFSCIDFSKYIYSSFQARISRSKSTTS